MKRKTNYAVAIVKETKMAWISCDLYDLQSSSLYVLKFSCEISTLSVYIIRTLIFLAVHIDVLKF